MAVERAGRKGGGRREDRGEKVGKREEEGKGGEGGGKREDRRGEGREEDWGRKERREGI